jgi:murein L,D-transpeptidase YcbB/YkuD
MLKAPTLLVLSLLFLASGPLLHARSIEIPQNTCQEIKGLASQDADSATAAQLCALIEAGRLDELRWPDCSSYRTQVEQFYRSSGYKLAWSREGIPTQQANAMIELFRAAEKKGFEPEDYDASRWAARVQALTVSGRDELARFDFALTVSSLRYFSDLYQGRVSPSQCQANLPQKHFEGAQFLRSEVVTAADVRAAVQKAEPDYEGYRRMVAALERYVSLARSSDGPPLPSIKNSVHPGEPYSGVQELAERLRQLGDLPVNAPMPASKIYGEPLVSAIKTFQQRHGLQPDGVIGRATLEELGVPLSRRVAQLKLALERWRWLPRNLGPRVLVVNIPEFRLRAYDDHRLTLTMRAIVGEALEHQTPIFADEMESIVFRPYWSVPESIQKEELVPLLRKNPAYLTKHKMEVVNGHEQVVEASAVDAKLLNQLASGSLRIRQQPGPANSLGLIKFLFPNQFGVYLHGTPQHDLFYQARRDFSHGCIRIEDPAALASWVLRGRPEWTEKRILTTMRGKKPVSVKVTIPIPVLILYGTAFVEENGEVHFFRDIYGHDETLEKALAAARH